MSDNHNISDELLAAFLDGNTSAADTRRVLKAAQHDAQLQELIRIASLVDEDINAQSHTAVIRMTALAAKKKDDCR